MPVDRLQAIIYTMVRKMLPNPKRENRTFKLDSFGFICCD